MTRDELYEMSWTLSEQRRLLTDTYWTLAKKLQETEYKQEAQRSDMNRLSDLNIAMEAIQTASTAVFAIRRGAKECTDGRTAS